MYPEIALDREIVRANARAWRTFAGVPLMAVVKGAGYGWGYAPLVDALEDHVSAFCVADESELHELRRYTQAPAVVLGSVPLHALEQVLCARALPTIGTPEELAVARRVSTEQGEPLRVRVGVRPAASWSGLSFEELRAFAPDLVRSGARVEVWGHVTDWENHANQAAHFRACVDALESAGVAVSGTDFASTSGARGRRCPGRKRRPDRRWFLRRERRRYRAGTTLCTSHPRAGDTRRVGGRGKPYRLRRAHCGRRRGDRDRALRLRRRSAERTRRVRRRLFGRHAVRYGTCIAARCFAFTSHAFG